MKQEHSLLPILFNLVLEEVMRKPLLGKKHIRVKITITVYTKDCLHGAETEVQQ